MTQSVVILHTGDWHSALRSGLIKPGFLIEEETGDYETIAKEVELSDWSKWVWYDAYLPMLEKTADFAGETPVISINTGDIVHGLWLDGYSYSDDLDVQVEIALASYDEMKRWIPGLKSHVLNYGTQRHDYGQAQGTRAIAKGLRERGYHVECDPWLSVPLAGGRVDCTHHGPGGSAIDWEGAARRHAIKLMRETAERGDPAPMAILRGHTHSQVTGMVNVPWGGNYLPTLMSVCPPLCGPNEYAIRYISARSQPYIKAGGTMIRVEDGRVTDYHAFYVQKDCRVIPVTRAYNSGKFCQKDGQFG